MGALRRRSRGEVGRPFLLLEEERILLRRGLGGLRAHGAPFRRRRCLLRRALLGERQLLLHVRLMRPLLGQLLLPQREIGLRLRGASLLAGFRTLRERKCGQHDHQRRKQRGAARNDDEPPVPPARRFSLPLHCRSRFELAPPHEHRLGQHVVEDLVASAFIVAVDRDRTQDALRSETVEDRLQLDRRLVGVVDEISERVRDLRSRRCDEELQRARRNRRLARRQGSQRSLEVRADDRPCAAELLERRTPQHGRARRPLDLPQPLQHELEIRRLDPGRAARVRRAGGGSDFCDHGVDKRFLDPHPVIRIGDRVPLLERTDDRGARGCSVEMVEAQPVGENRGNARLEAVESRKCVLANGDQHVNARALQQRRQVLEDRPLFVVEEVLLELVEDQERLARGRRQRRLHGPFVEQCDLCFRGELPEPSDDRRAQNGALADAARTVENGELRGEEIGDDHLGLTFPPEEEERVDLGVLETCEALVRRRGHCGEDAHAAACPVSPM